MDREVERTSLDDVSRWVIDHVTNTPGAVEPRDHDASLRISLEGDPIFADDDPGILSDSVEGSYYSSFKDAYAAKVERELRGDNEHNEPQGLSSRRFIHTSDTCISLFHARILRETMTCNVVLRSSNVVRTLRKDLGFIYHMGHVAYDLLHHLGGCRNVRWDISIYSAHLVR